jgi:hypothetical protein
MVATLFLGSYIYLPIYLLYIGAPFWTYWETSSLIMMAALLGSIALYCISYAHVATNRIDEQIAILTDLPKPPNLINSLFSRLRQGLQWLGSIVTPRIPMFVGSVLLLLTLVLTISESGCEQVVRHKGYEVVLGRATWSYLSIPSPDLLSSQLARFNYIALLLTAGFLGVVVLNAKPFSWFSNSRLRKLVFALVGLMFVAAVLDFSLFEPLGWYKVPIWLFTVIVWLRGSIFVNESFHQRWIRWRPIVLVLYTPFFLFALWSAYDERSLIGLPVFFAGLTLLMIGLVQLHWQQGREILVETGKPPP